MSGIFPASAIKSSFQTKFIFCESKANKFGAREFTSVNDRPTIRSSTQLSQKRNEYKVP